MGVYFYKTEGDRVA